MQINVENLMTAINENMNRVQADPGLAYARSRVGEVDGLQVQIMVTGKKENMMPKFFTHEAVKAGQPLEATNDPNYVDLFLVTYRNYIEAVERLLDLAEGDTGGSLAAAQVLLGLYNANNWHADLVDIACRLDEKNRFAALVLITGRGKLMREPHTVIENGQERFYALAEQWQHLRIDNRYK